MLRLEGISRTYAGGVHALRDVSLHIPAGMYGLLGPNGAGKSTLMRTIATLQPPDAGRITFGDLDVLQHPEQLRAVLGYLPQDFGLYPTMSAEAILDHFATLKGHVVPRARRDVVHALLQQVNLYEVRGQRVGGFSGGMRQRLGIAIALCGAPRLVIVDEPTAGLDPAERNRFLDLLAGIGDDVVVLLSTHIVEDVRELCSRMAILAQGQVVTEGVPAALLHEIRGRVWQRTVPRESLAWWQARVQVLSSRLVSRALVIHVYAESDPGGGFTAVEADLEDLYFLRVPSR